jgi:hypothetical protein
MSPDAPVAVSVVLNVVGLAELGKYGLRSWLLQDFSQPHEAILNRFVPLPAEFAALGDGANPQRRFVIQAPTNKN